MRTRQPGLAVHPSWSYLGYALIWYALRCLAVDGCTLRRTAMSLMHCKVSGSFSVDATCTYLNRCRDFSVGSLRLAKDV
ncbi:uncharacterized protein B0J16DRAFT_333367, partial [Fusarium flagelliforme]|uniref:uncharacterized protein n=1 Tax=Fusarium flagelliforme TaxID=2675880 RepID=UPI001E8EC399